MSLTDKDIDRIFREASNSAPKVEFKEAYWDEMNDFLNQEEKNKKGIYAMLSVGILALIGVSSLFLLPNQNKYAPEFRASIVNSNAFTENNTAALSFTNKNNLEKEKTVKHTNNFTKEKLDNKTKETEAQIIPINTGNTVNTSNSSKIQSNNSIQQSETTVLFGKSTASNSQERAEEKNNSELSNNGISTKIPLVAKSQATAIKKSKSPLEEIDETTSARLELKTTSMSDLSKSLGGNSFKSLDLMQRLKDRLYLELGFGMMQNYNSNLGGRSYTYSAALNYEFRKNWFRLRTGIGASLSSNTNLTYSTSAKIYDFGSRQSSNTLVYKNLYDVYVPIEVGASFKSLTFGLGYKYNFLNHSTSEFSTFNDGVLDEKKTYHGLKEGLRNNTSTAYFFIERKIVDRVELGIKMGTFLNSRASSSEQFTMEGNDVNPTFGFVYLKFNLIK